MSNRDINTGKNGRGRFWGRLALSSAIGFSLAAGSAFAQSNTKDSGTVATPVAAAPAVAYSYADVVNRVTPAVVTIHAEKRERASQQFPFEMDPFLDRFFGGQGNRRQQQPQQERKASALGSGVIVSEDGYILTNHHVVDGAEQIKVDLSDNRTVDAKLVGSDAPSDLAVLKVNAGNLPRLSLGNSDQTRVGDVVLALGNPLGVGKTVTMGIISAKGRQTGLSNGSFEDFLQTDAPINQGNSGGALVNTNGELIGINSQILSRTGGSIGIGFAIPSNMARTVMDQLISTGKVRRGQLGIVVQKVSNDIAASLGLKATHGVIVSQIQPGSAAERAGIKQGDVITNLNGVAVDEPNVFRNTIAGTKPGSEVAMTVVRNGQEQQIKTALGEFKPESSDEDASAPATGQSDKTGTGKLGIGVQPLTPELTRELQMPAGTQGLVVGNVDPSGPAADAGIQEGDIIVSVNQQPVRTMAELRAAVERSSTRPVLFLINRQGTTLFVTVKPRA
jgi:serine protease Do